MQINPELPKWTASVRDELAISGTRPWLAIAFTGNDFMPGVLEAAHAAAQAWPGSSIVWAERNLCYVPHFGLGEMKNFNIMRACEVGADFLLMLDCDILIGPNLPQKLSAWRKDILVPFYNQDGLADGPYRIMSPQFVLEGEKAIPIAWETDIDIQYPPSERIAEGNGSLVRMDWAVMSCLFFDTKIFHRNCLGQRPFNEVPIDRNDEYNCLFWRRQGATIWLDLNAHVTLLRRPGTTKEIQRIIGMSTR